MKQQKRRTSSGACARIEPLISMYVDGELNMRRVAAVRKHLDACPACAAKAKELSELSALLKLSTEMDASCEMSADVHASIMRSVAQSPRQSEHKSVRRGLWRTGTALIGVFLICGVLLMPGGPLNPVANAPSMDKNGMMGGGGIGDSVESPNTDNLPGADEPTPSEPMLPAPGDDGQGDVNDEAAEGLPGNGDVSDGDASHGTVVYRLYRVSGGGADEPAGDGSGATDGEASLLSQLNGAWQGNGMTLVLDIAEYSVELTINGQGTYPGDMSLQGDVLLLQLQNGTRIQFNVTVKGDTLWLTVQGS